MPLVNPDQFVDTLLNNTRDQNNNLLASITQFTGTRNPNDYWGRVESKGTKKFKAKPDRESALEVLNELGTYIKAGGQLGKALRPWDIIPNVFSGLDRTQPWWGWEFETGWKSSAARQKALEHAWDNYDGVMFDGEGEGNWQVEITFTPAEAYRHFDGSAPAYQFLDWVSKNPKLIYNGGGQNVGTHLNMSHPDIKGRDDNTYVARFLNRTLRATRKRAGDRTQLFGRELVYGGFYEQQAPSGHWVEFKGFRTAYTIEQFQVFCQTAAGLQTAMDYALSLGARDRELAQAGGLCMTNLYEVVFENAQPVYDTLATVKIADPRQPDCARGHFGNM